MGIYLRPLVTLFKSHADADIAVGMKQYMRNQFEFLGLKTPVRKELARQFLKEYGLPPKDILASIIYELWQMPEREFQYFALELFRRFKKQLEPDDVELIEYMIIHKSWWDTVDGIAPNLAGELFKRFPEMIPIQTTRWIRTDNIWLQRTAILFQLKYKDKTDMELLFKIILTFKTSKEFFIQKAMGWALREIAWRDAGVIQNFVSSHELPALTKREALKNLRILN